MGIRTLARLADDYRRVERAIEYLQKHRRRQPSLREVARSVHLSEYHFQRLFTRWAGISPKRFLQYLTLEHAKQLLRQSRPLLDAAYDSGLSGPGRLHDLFVTLEAMSPGEYKKNGEGVVIRHGFHLSPFGECLIAVTDRGLCGLSFVVRGDRARTLRELTGRWPGARLVDDARATARYAAAIFGGRVPSAAVPIRLLLKGTKFQVKVWEALLRIPPGSVSSYEDIAVLIGRPGAARAVGSAVARNPIGYLVPCHRVIRRLGLVGDYHWGAPRKQAMLGWEFARAHGAR